MTDRNYCHRGHYEEGNENLPLCVQEHAQRRVETPVAGAAGAGQLVKVWCTCGWMTAMESRQDAEGSWRAHAAQAGGEQVAEAHRAGVQGRGSLCDVERCGVTEPAGLPAQARFTVIGFHPQHLWVQVRRTCSTHVGVAIRSMADGVLVTAVPDAHDEAAIRGVPVTASR